MSVSVPEVTDPVAAMLVQQIQKDIQKITEANEVLLQSEDSTAGVREIDKELKTFLKSDDNDVSEKDQEIVKAVASLEKARAAFKSAQEKARNLYRVNVLHEDEVTESDVDEDSLKENVKQTRKTVMSAVTLLKDYSETNGLNDVTTWVNSLSIPQVGRAGASTVGQKKPRAYVSVNDAVHESFGEAAKAVSAALSTEDNKVEVTSPDLVTAWVEAGESENFEYQGLKIKVTPKEKKAA